MSAEYRAVIEYDGNRYTVRLEKYEGYWMRTRSMGLFLHTRRTKRGARMLGKRLVKFAIKQDEIDEEIKKKARAFEPIYIGKDDL